jgi:glycosyltransferase involved in cell wall biosynthesis
LRAFAERTKPDIVHAMRIPFEAMLAADAYGIAPLVTSAWGNDFTLHASSTALMRHYTEWTLEVSDALHADCHRDIRLGRTWGFGTDKPTLVVPGGGGVRTEVFFPGDAPAAGATVINARGARVYVRNDVFFEAIPRVLARRPDAQFVCVALEGDKDAARWVEKLGIQEAVTLLPRLSQVDLAGHLRRAQVMVSPSVHDGTPNSLLEGMACGCFPIAGDLESIREWITPGKNGILLDATDPSALAEAIVEALENANLRGRAAGLNQRLIMERAEYARCMAHVGDFYKRVLSGAAGRAGPTTAP